MAHHFDDDLGSANLSDDNVNSLDVGGNVYESPSGGLLVNVTPLEYFKQAAGGAWSKVSYAGATNQAVNASQTNYLYLSTAGALTVSTTGWPAAQHLPLAVVICGAATISSITDARPRLAMPYWT